MQLELSQVNEILEYFAEATAYNLEHGNISYNKKNKYESVSKEIVNQYRESQGEEGQIDFVFKITDELYVRVSCMADSYGKRTHNIIKFVKPEEKLVTVYESI